MIVVAPGISGSTEGSAAQPRVQKGPGGDAVKDARAERESSGITL
jgi:hypothetical protein